jgi:hypothetical protein
MEKKIKIILSVIVVIAISIGIYRIFSVKQAKAPEYSISINKEQQEQAKALEQPKEITEKELLSQYIGNKTEKINPQPITDTIVKAIQSLTSDNMIDIANQNFLGNTNNLSDILVMMSQKATVDNGNVKTAKNSDGTTNIAIPYLSSGKVAGLVLVRYMPNAKAYSMLTVVTPKQIKALQQK